MNNYIYCLAGYHSGHSVRKKAFFFARYEPAKQSPYARRLTPARYSLRARRRARRQTHRILSGYFFPAQFSQRGRIPGTDVIIPLVLKASIMVDTLSWSLSGQKDSLYPKPIRL
jgi:hypothetical protein